MAAITLTNNDNAVLSQIFDPESAPSARIMVDTSLPEDPHITDPKIWSSLKQQQLEYIAKAEAILKNKEPRSAFESCSQDLRQLIMAHSNCAFLYNDYAQMLRLQHLGNLPTADSRQTKEVFDVLSKAIDLLTPVLPQAALSPTQCKTLAQSHTQRGALIHGLAKVMKHQPDLRLAIPKLTDLSTLELQEAASRDFFMGGRYGNEVGKALAVHTNPTAKLCGQMVQNAMRQEFAAAASSTL